MPSDRFAVRRGKLLKQLRKAKADTILVTNYTNVSYLTGFTGDSSYLLLGANITLLISDTRYTTQISEECPSLDTYIRTNKEEIPVSVGKVAKKAKLSNIAFESGSVTVSGLEKLKSEAKNVEFAPMEGIVEELREIKDASEIAELRAAVDQAQRGFRSLQSSLLGTMTELQAAHDLEHAMRRFGGQGAAFEPIVAVGPRAALPHARPGNDRISDSDFVLIDWGSLSAGGYRSDLTRVLVTGRISAKLEKIYRIVLRAQRKAIDAIRPGAACKDVDAVARKEIDNAGHGKHFGHGLGHGIGLDIHEGPRFSPISESVLKPGMVVTVEPGIYLPGWGGVRIEDDVLVTRTGSEVLTSAPKEFDDIVCS